MDYTNTNKSRYLSLVLRHKPESIGLELDANGWGSVDIILDKLNLTMEQLKGIVKTNDKKRFEFDDSENPTQIRARQGHTIDVDVELTEYKEPIVLYHATPTKNKSSIEEKGLLKGQRNHVHLSDNVQTAVEAAKRRSKDVIIYEISFNGGSDEPKLFRSNNGVYLCESVPFDMLIEL